MSLAAAILRPSLTRRTAFGPLWLAVPGLAFLLVFFVLPVASLLVLSIENADTGQFTAAHYLRMASASVYLRVLGITFRICGETALFSVLLGYPLAYWLARQPASRRGRLVLLVLVPFWTSYLVKTFAWMILLGRSGVINGLLGSAGIIDAPLSLLHNELGVMIGMVHAMLPLAVLTMLPVMTGIDQRLGLAAGTLGAAPGQAFWLVFFPLSMPGLAAAGLLTFISSLGFFVVPALLGGRQQTMLAQMIITQVQELLNWGFAGALAMLMLVAALVTCWLYDRVFGLSSLSGEGGRHAGAQGRGRRLGLAALHAAASLCGRMSDGLRAMLGDRALGWVLPAYGGLILTFLVVPALLVLPMGFTSSSFLEFPPPGYGLKWFEAYFSSPVWIAATVRSFGVALATAVLATALGAAAALALARSTSRWRGLVFSAFLAPMIVPRIILAVGLFYLFARMGLVASDLGLVIGHTVLALPFALVAVSAVLKSYDWRLDQAAATLGASRFQALRLVTVPIVKGGLGAAFLFAFITSFDELSIALFVSGGIKTTLPKQMWDDMILQLNPTLAAVSVVIFVLITSLLLVAEEMRRRAAAR